MKSYNKKIVITSGVRTAIGSLNGSLKEFFAHDLGKMVIKEAINRSNLLPEEIDEVVIGQVLTGGSGQNPARQAAINAGVPVSKPSYIINQVCGSGLRSVASAYQSILLGENKIVVAGGQESMSNAPHTINIRSGLTLKKENLKDTLVNDGLWDAFNNYHMGITAENVSKKWEISRNEQDKFAVQSQIKAQNAIRDNRFKEEIISIKSKTNKKNFIQDEHPRNVTLESLSKLRPVFKKNGTVTAGNSSGINDGAAAVVLMEKAMATKKNIDPLCTIVSWAICGVDPSLMGSGPIPASKKALKKANWTVKDLDLVETNEAFAAQSLAVIKDLKIPKEKINVNGGAIALGHPIGASGTRVLVTLAHEMKKRDLKRGLATLCIGGGMGIAMCVKREN